jgi:hypothetical protein
VLAVPAPLHLAGVCKAATCMARLGAYRLHSCFQAPCRCRSCTCRIYLIEGTAKQKLETDLPKTFACCCPKLYFTIYFTKAPHT